MTRVRAEFRQLPGEEIGRLRMEGHDGIFEHVDRLELAYATDTLARVLDSSPEVLESRVLIMEATYLDERRAVEEAQARQHTHLDELLARADRIQSEAVVLMHFSQIYGPGEVRRIIEERAPESLRGRLVAFAPEGDDWFG